MRIAHIADVHLGYRAYNRINRLGLNAREVDVFDAFRQAMAKIAEINADIVLVAGDLFHTVRPSNMMIQYAFREISLFRRKTSAPVVIIGGNHDSPRSADTGCILDLFQNIEGVYVVHGKYEQVYLKNLDASVFCLCHRVLPQRSSLQIQPDPSSKYNILMVHGTVDGVARNVYDTDIIQRSEVINDSWDYVAFGHYHTFEQLAPNAYYSGSLEYASTTIWSEAGVDKGFVEYDLDKRELVEFHKVETRDVIDLRPIDASDIKVDDLNKMLEMRIGSIPGGHENKIIRLIVENVHRSVQSEIDFAMIRKVRAEALHFDLQFRPPQKAGRSLSSNNPGTTRPLEEEWEEFAREYSISPSVDRERLIKLGREYLLRNAPVE